MTDIVGHAPQAAERGRVAPAKLELTRDEGALAEATEGWLSGRRRRTRNPLYRLRYRGFESLSLRQDLHHVAPDSGKAGRSGMA